MALGGAAAAWPTLVRDLFAGSICGVVSVAIGLSAAIDPMADLTRFGTTLTCALCGGAHALERARLQPPDRGGVHVVGSRHVRLRLASIKPRQGFLPLVWRDAERSFRSSASFRPTAFPTSGACLPARRSACGPDALRRHWPPCFAASTGSGNVWSGHSG